jgi:hypothetical protein
MFIERPEDAEQAELFAMGLIKEPKDYGTLVLVPCKHKKLCRTHGTFWINLRTNKSKTKIKIREILGK